MSIEYAYFSFEFSAKLIRQIVLDGYVQRRGADDGRLDYGRMLHFKERLDGLYFRFISLIGQRAPFSHELKCCHPFSILFFLYYNNINCEYVLIINNSRITYVITSDAHFSHAVCAGHFQFNAELVL